ncbi:MAG: glycosyltransferase family 4 protein, partial [Deltaproteobacteria bacterium]|nr:glycosyltransferase family 4 protein [Deltaproteobacteria bacterium]
LTEGVLELRALPCPRDRTQDDLLLLRTSAFAGLRRAHLADDAPARALVDRATSRGEALLVREDFCGLLRGATLPERRAEAPPPAPEPLWQRPLTQAGPLWKRVRQRLERQLGADRVGRFLHPVKEAVTEAALNVDAARTAVSLRQNPLALSSILSPCARAERAWIEKLPVPLDGPPPTAYATPPTAHATPPTPFATPPTATFAPRTLDTRSPITAPGKPRLVLSLPWVVPGGVDKAAIEQAQWLHEDGHEVLLATHNAAAHLWLPKLSPFLREHALLGELCTEERKADALVAFTRRFDARALLMSHSWIGLDALPKLKAGLPRVRTADFVHMEDPRPGAQYAQVASEKFDRFLDLRLVAHAFARRRLVDWGVPESKIRTIHLGCDELGTCDPARTPTGHLRGALGLPIPQGAKVVGFVGRFAEEKDPLLLVRTYAALSASAIAAGLPAPHFVMVGDGPLKPAAQAKADECGIAAQTHFLPADADVPRVLRDLSLVLMAGRLEGLPLVFFEALSLGTPVVTTDIQGIPELVDDAVGACVPHGSDETVRLRSLVEAALPLLRDDALRAAKGQAGRARVLAHFSTAQRKEKFRAAMAELVR